MGLLSQLVYVSGLDYYSLLEWFRVQPQFNFSVKEQRDLVHIKVDRNEKNSVTALSVNSLN